MKQTAKKIYDFKKGDKITRIQPSKPVMKLGDEEMVDRNYIGTPFIFVGLANGCIYLKKQVPELNESQRDFLSILTMIGGDSVAPMIHLELDLFEDGWDYYVDPNTLGEETEEKNTFTAEELENQKLKALQSEDYKEADRIQKILNNLNK